MAIAAEGTFFISSNDPGKYCFAEDIAFSPTGEVQFAFTIDRDNVHFRSRKARYHATRPRVDKVGAVQLIPGHKKY